jgi:hypothetical protein
MSCGTIRQQRPPLHRQATGNAVFKCRLPAFKKIEDSPQVRSATGRFQGLAGSFIYTAFHNKVPKQ